MSNSNVISIPEIQLLDNFEELMEKKMAAVKAITKTEVREDFSFMCGKLLGLYRAVLQHPKQQKELLEALSISKGMLMFFRKVSGWLPYLNSAGIKVEGKDPLFEDLANLVRYTCQEWGIPIDESMVADINAPRWAWLKERAEASLEAVPELNEITQEVEYIE